VVRRLALVITTAILLSPARIACAQGASTFNAALTEYSKGNFSQSAQMFERCLASSGANASVAYYCALANIGNRNIARGKQLLQYVVTSFPSSAEATSAKSLLSKMGVADTPRSAGAANSGTIASSANVVSRSAANDEMASLPDSAKIRFRRGDNGHMEVDAYVNGRLMPAWFDTGANGFLGKNNLVSCGVNPPSGPPTDHAQGWAGVPVPIWTMPLQVRIGDLTRTIHVAVQDNLEGIKPLFGQDFIAGYQYNIDEAGGTLNLRKNRGSSSATSTTINRAYEVPCQKVGKDDYVPLSVSGKTVPVFIDTGAARTILNQADFSRLDISMPSDAPTLGMSGVGGGFTCREIELDLKLGPINRMGFKVLVGGNASSCVGQDFLEGWRFTVDHDRHVLSFFH
jgi:predicted aspartyl protease